MYIHVYMGPLCVCVCVCEKVSELEVSNYMQEVVGTLQTARRRGQRFLHQTSITKVCCCTCIHVHTSVYMYMYMYCSVLYIHLYVPCIVYTVCTYKVILVGECNALLTSGSDPT